MLVRSTLALIVLALAGCSDVDTGAGSSGTTSGGEATTGTTAGPGGSVTSADPPTTDPTTNATGDATGDATGGGSGGATGGANDNAVCQEVCQADDDCVIDVLVTDFVCEAGRCTRPTPSCTSDDSCRIVSSGWLIPCTAQIGCPGQVCIDIGGGEGRCATQPSDLTKCETIMQSEVAMPAIEGDMEFVVCTDTRYTCNDGTCENPCEDDLECVVFPGHPRCEVATGTCKCTTDQQCQATGESGWTRCNDGVCGCGSDADCTANADICTASGTCGCTSVAACTSQTFDGTTPVCEPA